MTVITPPPLLFCLWTRRTLRGTAASTVWVVLNAAFMAILLVRLSRWEGLVGRGVMVAHEPRGYAVRVGEAISHLSIEQCEQTEDASKVTGSAACEFGVHGGTILHGRAVSVRNTRLSGT